MRNLRLPAALAGLLAVCSLASTPMAKASLDFATGSVCQLSIPTTDTRFRPKATGARNESTTASNFVICPLQNRGDDNDLYTSAYLAVYSLDGIPRDVTCTAVSGWQGGGSGIYYSSKTVKVSDTGEGNGFGWDAADFGGTAGGRIVGSLGFSVTCMLPPQTAISLIQGGF
jgi:hypothetical protein